VTKGLKRFYGHGDLHFLTFSCYQRLPFLGTAPARDLFVQTLGKVRERYQFRLVGYVVMPNHVHLLISEGPRATPSVVLKVLKQLVSRDLRGDGFQIKIHTQEPTRENGVWGTHGVGHSTPHRFWQPRFYDFNVWSEAKVREKLAYMHANPVTRKLVDHPKDWPWSSWSFYATGQGPLNLDLV